MMKKVFLFTILVVSMMIMEFRGGRAEVVEEYVYLPMVLNAYGGSLCHSPNLVSPANGSDLTTLVPLFQWDRGLNPLATRLTLQVALDDTFSSILHSYTTTSAHWNDEFRFPWNLTEGTIYYWRTYLLCGEEPGVYSDAWGFSTPSGGSLLAAPDLLSPADGFQLGSTSVNLEWGPVGGAQEYLVKWQKVGSTATSSKWVADTQWTINSLSAGSEYEWWVSGVDGYGIGNESTKRSFMTP